MKLHKLKHFTLALFLVICVVSDAQNVNEKASTNKVGFQLNDSILELTQLAKTNFIKGNLTNSLVLCYDALKYVEQEKSPIPTYDLYTTLGNIYTTLREFEKAFYFFNLADQIAQELNQNNLLLLSYQNFSHFYLKLEQTDSAEKYLNKTLEIYKLSDSDNLNEITLFNQAEINKYKGNLEPAIRYYQKSLEKSVENKNLVLQVENYIALSEIQIKKGNFNDAEDLVSKCLEITNQKTLINEYKVYEKLSLIFETKGQFQESLQYHKKFIELRDSILTSPKTKNVSKLYSTIQINNQKDRNLKLNEYIAKQVNSISKKNNIRNVIIAIFLFTFIVLTLYILSYKNKIRANKILQEQNKQITLKNQEIRQKTEKLLGANQELEKLSIAANQTDNAILITNADGRVEWINEGYTRLYGYTFDEFLKHKGKTYIESSSNPNIKGIIEKVITEKKSQIYEAVVESKNGKKYPIQTTLTPILNENNEIARLIAIDSDISKLKKIEEELKKLLATKDKFFSIIAHDLKNPFNSIIGLAQLLVHGYDRLSTEKIKYFHNNLYLISKNGYELLINLLEWSRSQMGTIQYKPKELNLHGLCEETFSLYNGKAIQKEISLINSTSEDAQVLADQNMIKTILRNLVSNALKFTDRGGAVEILEKDFSEFKEITVRDTGIGIDSEDIKKLFKLDETYSTEGTEDEIGTGLGLILCKEFIEKHGGNIHVESKVGFGSKFIFTLPLNNKIPS